MNNNIKVSVILSSYNHAKYIRQSIESVLNQTFTNFELIIWDDASTDTSWEIINSYSDPRIKAFRNKDNIQTTMSFGLRVAQGEYVAVHNSDDAWEPTKLEKQVTILDENPDFAAVFTHVQIIDENGRHFSNEKHVYYKIFEQPNRDRYGWLNYFFHNGNALCHASVLIRKDCFNMFMYRKGMAQLPDFDLWVQLCLQHEIHIIQEKLTLFRVRDNEANASGDHPINRVRMQFELLKLMDHYKNIDSIDDLLKIFPDAEKFTDKNNPDILFALGRYAVETGHSNAIKLFGLNLLFDAINDPKRANKLEKYQQFTRKTFVNLTAENDIFTVEELRNYTKKIDERDQEILYYALSKSWRITRPLRKLMAKLKGNKHV